MTEPRPRRFGVSPALQRMVHPGRIMPVYTQAGLVCFAVCKVHISSLSYSQCSCPTSEVKVFRRILAGCFVHEVEFALAFARLFGRTMHFIRVAVVVEFSSYLHTRFPCGWRDWSGPTAPSPCHGPETDEARGRARPCGIATGPELIVGGGIRFELQRSTPGSTTGSRSPAQKIEMVQIDKREKTIGPGDPTSEPAAGGQAGRPDWTPCRRLEYGPW